MNTLNKKTKLLDIDEQEEEEIEVEEEVVEEEEEEEENVEEEEQEEEEEEEEQEEEKAEIIEKKTLIISIGQDKGQFECPQICMTSRPFPKTSSCIDVVSYDVGTTHLAVARLRFDRDNMACCIVEGALIDIYNPWDSLKLDIKFGQGNQRKNGKPDHVEPFSAQTWPPLRGKQIVHPNSETDKHLRKFHENVLQQKKETREEAKTESLQWAHDVEVLSLALHWIPWIHGSDIDHVLFEQQQHDNTKMRCISYCLLDTYQNRRLLAISLQEKGRIASVGEKTVLELFPSTLKLSPKIINLLLQSWIVMPSKSCSYKEPKKAPASKRTILEQHQQQAREKQQTGEKEEEGVKVKSLQEIEDARKQRAKNNRNNTMLHDDLVDHATHGTKKQSASRVLTYFFKPKPIKSDNGSEIPSKIQHPFYNWLMTQRAEKHNVCDAILQAMAFIIKNEQQPRMIRQRKKRAKAISNKTVST